MTVQPCPICGGHHAEKFFSLSAQPVLIGVLWPDADSARSCKKGDIDLAFCPDCGFIWNTAFDPSLIEYDSRYDNSLMFSPTFREYTDALVERLIRSYRLHGAKIVDIGCGKGDFLVALCERGENFGYGFDPSYEEERIETAASERITWSNDLYGAEHADIPADLIVSRFVYEHIPAPRDFLAMIRETTDDAHPPVIFFEVPNVDLIIRQMSVWDVIYEHCSYFSVESLTHAFAVTGFDVLRVEETYNKQFLTIDARAGAGSPGTDTGNLDALRRDVASFRDQQEKKRTEWDERIAGWAKGNARVAAWGAGAKAVGFLNMLHVADAIPRVVDINPHKRGKHLAGTGQRIVAPSDLTEDPPDIVILMNPIYRTEIAGTLADLGLSPELVEA